MVSVFGTTRKGGLNYRRQVELPKADQSTAANQPDKPEKRKWQHVRAAIF